MPILRNLSGRSRHSSSCAASAIAQHSDSQGGELTAFCWRDLQATGHPLAHATKPAMLFRDSGLPAQSKPQMATTQVAPAAFNLCLSFLLRGKSACQAQRRSSFMWPAVAEPATLESSQTALPAPGLKCLARRSKEPAPDLRLSTPSRGKAEVPSSGCAAWQ